MTHIFTIPMTHLTDDHIRQTGDIDVIDRIQGHYRLKVFCVPAEGVPFGAPPPDRVSIDVLIGRPNMELIEGLIQRVQAIRGSNFLLPENWREMIPN